MSFRFVDIDGIVDHHCLNFFFFIMVLYVLLQVNSFSNISFKIIPVILHWKKVNTNNLMVGDYRGGGGVFFIKFSMYRLSTDYIYLIVFLLLSTVKNTTNIHSGWLNK